MEPRPGLPPPFTADSALSKETLDFVRGDREAKDSTRTTEATKEDNPLVAYLPGEPRVPLDVLQVHQFLTRELATPLIDELYPWICLLATKAGDNVSSLHRNEIKGTRIVPAEDPKLHLVWDHERIYIKPLPIWLLNHQVWSRFLSEPDTIAPYEAQLMSGLDRRTAMGFLRSYGYLIRHPIDLKMAREAGLIPEGLDVDWVGWTKFIAQFTRLSDEEVSKRYHFGHIRLNRLNWCIRLFRPASSRSSWYYLQPHWSVARYIEGMFNYLLFSFAMISLVLSAMQVAAAVPEDQLGFRPSEAYFLGLRQAFWIFPSMVLYAAAALGAMMLAIPVGRLAVQLSWALRTGGKKRRHSAKHDYLSN